MQKILTFLLAFFSFSSVEAGISLPEIFSDNMVLQQNSNVKLWGSAKKKKSVTIRVSWSDEVFKTKADKDGKWLVEIPTGDGSFETRSICISDGKSKHEIKNILIGEVWLCSGQSNMEMFFKGFMNQPISSAEEVYKSANENNGIRILTVKRNLPDEPVDDAAGKWKLSNAKNAKYFTAVGYHFAEKLRDELNVPVGIINSSYGGSTIEGWIPKELLKKFIDVDLNEEIPDSIVWRKPHSMYNGMIAPITDYVVNGFLWYQGEGSIDRHATYSSKLIHLIENWRNKWGLGELPFYIVEITPYEYDDPLDAALLREAQFRTSEMVNNCKIVCTNDLILEHELKVAHPSLKKPIGIRLANIALENAFGIDSIQSCSPSFKSMESLDSGLIVHFANTYGGIQEQENYIGFEIAGEDGILVEAKAKLMEDGSSFLLTAEGISNPIKARYCFKGAQLGNVQNSVGLPLFGFRTDKPMSD